MFGMRAKKPTTLNPSTLFVVQVTTHSRDLSKHFSAEGATKTSQYNRAFLTLDEAADFAGKINEKEKAAKQREEAEAIKDRMRKKHHAGDYDDYMYASRMEGMRTKTDVSVFQVEGVSVVNDAKWGFSAQDEAGQKTAIESAFGHGPAFKAVLGEDLAQEVVGFVNERRFGHWEETPFHTGGLSRFREDEQGGDFVQRNLTQRAEHLLQVDADTLEREVREKMQELKAETSLGPVEIEGLKRKLDDLSSKLSDLSSIKSIELTQRIARALKASDCHLSITEFRSSQWGTISPLSGLQEKVFSKLSHKKLIELYLVDEAAYETALARISSPMMPNGTEAIMAGKNIVVSNDVIAERGRKIEDLQQAWLFGS